MLAISLPVAQQAWATSPLTAPSLDRLHALANDDPPAVKAYKKLVKAEAAKAANAATRAKQQAAAAAKRAAAEKEEAKKLKEEARKAEQLKKAETAALAAGPAVAPGPVPALPPSAVPAPALPSSVTPSTNAAVNAAGGVKRRGNGGLWQRAGQYAATSFPPHGFKCNFRL
eukprot:4862845-Pleurochrysis_carterae.AAC.2